MNEDSPLDDVFVNEEEYEKQHQNQEEKDYSDIYPSQIFRSKFYKLNNEQKKQKLASYLRKTQTINRISVRKSVSKEHSEDCKALEYTEEGRWDTPWTFAQSERLHYDEEEDEWQDNVEIEHHRSTQYVLLKCNDTECMATLCVKADDLLQIVPARIEDL